MFVLGGLSILLAVILLLTVGLLEFSRKLSWLGRLPGDFRYEGRRTRVYAPSGSMLLLSLLLSLLTYFLSVIF
jgi:Protein of unknown function (DUF2905)